MVRPVHSESYCDVWPWQVDYHKLCLLVLPHYWSNPHSACLKNVVETIVANRVAEFGHGPRRLAGRRRGMERVILLTICPWRQGCWLTGTIPSPSPSLPPFPPPLPPSPFLCTPPPPSGKKMLQFRIEYSNNAFMQIIPMWCLLASSSKRCCDNWFSKNYQLALIACSNKIWKILHGPMMEEYTPM